MRKIERLAAYITNQTFMICRDPLVYFQDRGSGKVFTTYITQKALVTDAVHLVRIQVRSCHKSFATYITKEGPVTSVNPAVLLQISSCVVLVGLAALNTHIGFITCVGPFMQLQALGLAESAAAYITHKCLMNRVDFCVCISNCQTLAKPSKHKPHTKSFRSTL